MELIATLLFNLVVYIFGYHVIKHNGGVKKNLPFAFSLLLFSLYHFITPVYFYLSGRETIWGDESTNRNKGEVITDYYLTAINYYGLANLFFIIGYILISHKRKVVTEVKRIVNRHKIKVAITAAFCICFGIVLFNFLKEGLNPFLVLFGSQEDIIAGKTATSNYLKNFADSLIAIVIIGYYFKLNKPILYPMTIISFVLFGLMGFRYRIILTILGIIFVSIYHASPSHRKIIRNATLLLVVFYFMFFITYNRFVVTSGDWNRLVVNPIKFEYSLFFEQTRGMLDDITIIKYYKTDPDPKYDHGISFLYFLVRAMPRSIVGDEFKDSFYPYPALPIIEEAYDVQKYWGKTNTGEAPLHMIYFYIAGGFSILIIGSLLTGLALRWIQIKFYPVSDRNILLSILIAAGLFQWYTRGYFPGFVDHMAFMLIGFWMIMAIYKIPKVKMN